MSHRDDHYETPKPIVKDIEKDIGLKFNIDVCASRDNRKCHYFIGENEDALKEPWKQSFAHPTVAFCNPPRSKNGKFVDRAWEQWQTYNIDIVMMLCWNDLGNKYGKKLVHAIVNSDIEIVINHGKIKFWKEGVESEFPSRLTYFSAWFKSKPIH